MNLIEYADLLNEVRKADVDIDKMLNRLETVDNETTDDIISLLERCSGCINATRTLLLTIGKNTEIYGDR